jgi:hypothetical protein
MRSFGWKDENTEEDIDHSQPLFEFICSQHHDRNMVVRASHLRRSFHMQLRPPHSPGVDDGHAIISQSHSDMAGKWEPQSEHLR